MELGRPLAGATCFSKRRAAVDIHVQRHLDSSGRVNLGSFYTPYRYVLLVRDWLEKYGLTSGKTILDSSCGYGAFFELQEYLPKNRYIGNDIDSLAVNRVSEVFPKVQTFNKNALFSVSRERYGIGNGDCLVVVGNPPYNDVTSQINQKIKSADMEMDADIRTRDLGLSSLLSYDKLAADYVAVLHPLSYLVKRQNFSAARNFFANYRMLEHAVFSSQEFANTSKTTGFPVVVALYRRAPAAGLSYDDVYRMTFRTVEGKAFSLANFDYVADFIRKYPHRERFEPEILFYTLRDINALKRSRTFIKERCSNAVDVNPEKLPYYCYLDCFKRYADVPYYMGNFDVPFDKATFPEIENAVLAVSKFHHPEVFGKSPKPSASEERAVVKYIARMLI